MNLIGTSILLKLITKKYISLIVSGFIPMVCSLRTYFSEISLMHLESSLITLSAPIFFNNSFTLKALFTVVLLVKLNILFHHKERNEFKVIKSFYPSIK